MSKKCLAHKEVGVRGGREWEGVFGDEKIFYSLDALPARGGSQYWIDTIF